MRKSLLASIGFLAVLAATPALAGAADEGPLTVSVGYADTLRAPGGHPGIWEGTKNVTFYGTRDPYDSGVIKLHNQTPVAATIQRVTVDIGTMLGVNVWTKILPVTIPPGAQIILAQTAFYNFDTSDMPDGRVTCSPNGIKPIVHVTVKVGSSTPITYTYIDTTQILNTGGIDAAICGKVENTDAWAKIEVVNDGGKCH